MLGLLLLQAAVPTVGALDRQALPSRGCAAYLWNVADRSFTAMAGAASATLRVKLDGKVVDLPRVAEERPGGYGLAAMTTYRAGGTVATLALTIAPRADLAAGAVVPQATLTLQREGSDELVQPVAGLIGCATPP